MLAYQIDNYKNGEKHLSAYDMNRLLTQVKNDGEHEWLKKVSNISLQRSCADLAFAYDMFFKKISGFPKFKSKKNLSHLFLVGKELKDFIFLKTK